MMDELHDHLDGETRASLAPELHDQLDAWERMVASFRIEAPRGDAPAWLERQVMSEITALPGRGPLGRALAWLTGSRPLRVSPLAMGLAAAGIAALVLLPQRVPRPAAESGPTTATRPAGSDAGGPVADEAVVYVQFVLEAPGAASVAVAGDFSGWQPMHALADPDEDGIWTARVPVRPGVHGYMFLIDGTSWRTDPRAERYQDDGFGNRNAVLAVTESD